MFKQIDLFISNQEAMAFDSTRIPRGYRLKFSHVAVPTLLHRTCQLHHPTMGRTNLHYNRERTHYLTCGSLRRLSNNDQTSSRLMHDMTLTLNQSCRVTCKCVCVWCLKCVCAKVRASLKTKATFYRALREVTLVEVSLRAVAVGITG